MVDVNGISIARADEIEQQSIVGGLVDAAGNLILTNGAGEQINAGQVTRQPQIDFFGGVSFPGGPNHSGTWFKPQGAKVVQVIVIGAGGSGAGAANYGGGGGNGGAWNECYFEADNLPDEVDCVGANFTAGGAANNAGVSGNASYFGTYLQADGGQGGNVNFLSPSSNPHFTAGMGGGTQSPGTQGTTLAPIAGGTGWKGGGGGGTGATIAAAGGDDNGGQGGRAGGGAGAAPSSGQLATGGIGWQGGQGGAGGGVVGGAGQPGGNGGLWGGGGGGGGYKATPNRGAGGRGAAGVCIVITYF